VKKFTFKMSTINFLNVYSVKEFFIKPDIKEI